MIVVHIKVSFLTMDVKDALITLCGLYFGPVSTVLISVLVSFLELITISETGLYGFLMNIIGSVAFALTVSLFYKWKKTLWNAVWGLVSGVLVMTAVMVLANLFITPYFLGTTMEAVRGLIPGLLLPFNLLKGVINAGLVLLLYKPLSRALRKMAILERREGAKGTEGEHPRKLSYTGLFVTLTALVLIAGALILIFTVLGGHFGFGI
jgi:riboflavin transporter FmnP